MAAAKTLWRTRYKRVTDVAHEAKKGRVVDQSEASLCGVTGPAFGPNESAGCAMRRGQDA